MGAGAGFGADSENEVVPLVTARWAYVEAKWGVREMRRIGLAA